MKYKNAYLLIFCISLNYYCYLCYASCSSYQASDPPCETYAAYDIYGYHVCRILSNGKYNYCGQTDTFTITDCESAYSIINKKGRKIRDNGLCEGIPSDLGKCVYDNGKCVIKKCEELTNGCESFPNCGTYGDVCKINDCQGFSTEGDCKIKTLDENNMLFCKWENNNCITISKCSEGLNECSLLPTSGEEYICFSDGLKCVEAKSCEDVKVTNAISEKDLSLICSKFPHCSSGNNYDCINSCNNITNEDECNYSLKDKETFIKCKWAEDAPDNKKCQVDGYIEIKSCDDAKNLNDIRDE